MNLLKLILDWVLVVTGVAGVGWGLFSSFKNSDGTKGLAIRWIVTLVLVLGGSAMAFKLSKEGAYLGLMPLFIMSSGLVLAILWTPALSELSVRLLTNILDGGSDSIAAKPLYSMAMSKRGKGKYHEAILAIREQLVQFPDDMQGTMMIAEIQAEDLKDMQAAEMTLNDFCANSRLPAGQFAAAMNHLADWQLQIGQDADAARAALEKIVDRFPGSEMALVAAQRIAHLSDAEGMLRAKNAPKTIALPQGVQNVGLLESSAFLQAAQEDPVQMAGAYVKHLEKHPHDTEVREKLAVIYADHYGRLDMATMELAQIIDQPNQPIKRVAHCLTVLANLQIRHGADYDTVRQTLERIVASFPNLPVARSAQSRIDHLRLEIKGQPAENTSKRIKLFNRQDKFSDGAEG